LRSGRVNQKLRTRNLLLGTAATLIAQGQTPGVAEVADMAKVSRRTAWRYFPTKEKLLADATLEGVRSVMEAEIASAPAGTDPASVELRLRTAVESIMRRAFENEGLLRTMIHTTVLEPPRRMPKRGIRRVQWIEDAIAPLRTQLEPAAWKRLVTGLTVCVGIEAMLVLRDIHGMAPAQAIRVCQWMSVALVREALANRQPVASGSGRTRKRGGK
jgi:AcrR family transcriptional regulator